VSEQTENQITPSEQVAARRTPDITALRARAATVAEQIGRRRLLALALFLLVIVSPWPPLTALLLLGYAAVAWNDPGWTVALLPLAAPFAYRPKGLPNPRALDSVLLFPAIELFLLIALATSALYLLGRWRREARGGTGAAATLDLWDGAKRLLSGQFGPNAAALLIIATISLLTVADRFHLRESIREYRTIIIEPVLYFFLARAWLRDRTLRTTAIAAFIGGGAMVGLLAIGQVVTGQSVVAVEGVRRALGTYNHPNALALYLVRAGTFALALLLFAPLPRRAVGLLVALPILLVALLLTFSRGALVGLGIAMALLLLALVYRRDEGDWPASRLRIVLAAACGLYAIGTLLVVILSATGAITLRGGDSLGLREMIWSAALAMIRDHPAFGVGLDQFYYQYAPRYVNPAAWGERYTSHPHNLFLDFWARLGIMGLAWIAWTLLALGATVSRGWRFARGDNRRIVLAVAVAAAAGLVHGLVDNFYFLIDLAFIWWFLLALGAIASDEIVATVPERSVAPARNRRQGRRRRERNGPSEPVVAVGEGRES
jgi:O-antigen ligase